VRPFQLEDMTETPDGRAWTPAQSTVNDGVVTELVNASDPTSSRLLRKPLAASAGGMGHTGGTYWDSTSDAEYQRVLEWIRMLPPEQFTPDPEPTLDFEFYRSCVQRMYDTPRYGQLSCQQCHAAASRASLRGPPTARRGPREARRGFEAIRRLIIPARPRGGRTPGPPGGPRVARVREECMRSAPAP
jgi:hypothetical protein